MKIIQKVYEPKVGNKVNIQATRPYTITTDAGKSFPFNAQIMDRNNNIIENKVVYVPAQIMEEWDTDEVIINYVLSQLGLTLDLDNTIDMVLAKLNSGTITYASGTQEENDIILQNYALFISLQIESYKKGDIEIDDFIDISDYDVNISLGSENFTMKEFVKSLVSLPEVDKQSKLNSCITAITQQIEEENNTENTEN
jgi:hypothetical protein